MKLLFAMHNCLRGIVIAFAAVVAVSVAGCGGERPGDAADAPSSSAAQGATGDADGSATGSVAAGPDIAALPPDAEALSLLGEPLRRPELPPEVASEYQANLEEFIDTAAAEADAATIFLSVCTSERAYAATMREVAAAEDIPALDVRAVFSEHIDALEAGELYPTMVDHYRQLYGDLFEQRRAYAVTSDGCHPHRVGHSLIADALVPLVRQVLGQPALPSSAPGESQ